jgi:formylglycine-generating enzyme required for sulfatase activity
MKWRHRSFLEFFAGCRLAGLWQEPGTREQARGVLADVHRVLDQGERDGEIRLFETAMQDGSISFAFRDLRADWQWTLRFALGHAHDDVRQNVPAKLRNDARSDLARELIALGNPWVVYDALERDHLEFDADVAATVCWLVHRDWANRDYRGAVAEGTAVPVPTPKTIARLQHSLIRSQRDSACLVTACEILDDWTVESLDAARPGALVQQLVPRFSRERGQLTSGQAEALAQFFGRFVAVPGGTFDAKQFHPAMSAADWKATGVPNPKAIKIAPFEMADFSVTNLIYECFDPGHHRWRDWFSQDDEQPVLWVNWHMAQAFCAWLTVHDPAGRKYRLPTEWEWEWACRWQGESTGDFWWGDQKASELMNCAEEAISLGGQTNTRQQATERFQKAQKWHPSQAADQNGVGLLDLHGNVWEWCWNVNAAGSSGRVLRGGSSLNHATDCLSSYRGPLDAAGRGSRIGFRLVRSG